MTNKANKTAGNANTGGSGGPKVAVPQIAPLTTATGVEGAAGGGSDMASAATGTSGDTSGPQAGAGQAIMSGAADLGNAQKTDDGAGGAGGPGRRAANRFGMPRSIRVTGPEKGRRRAGMRFTREPVILEVDDLTDETLAALAADPELTIVPEEADF